VHEEQAGLEVPVRVAVAELTNPARLAVIETVAETPFPSPVWVIAEPERETLPALVLIVYVFAAS
jgi:hypothetical protein